MNDKRSPFYAFRYLVTPLSDQKSIFQPLDKSKEELMADIVKSITESTKTEWTKRSKRFLFYGFQSRKNIHILKFAKETNERVYIEGDDDIEIHGITEAKFIYLIIDIKHQIILVERNISVFQDINAATNILAEYFREKMREFDYVVNIYPLVSNKKFWHYVESADKIYELSLVLNSPNMAFFGHEDTRDVLKQIQDTTNNEEFDIAFKSKEGKLRIAKETLGGWIEYVREVGGKYLLKFSKDGAIDTKTSQTDTTKTYIPIKKNEKYTEEELDTISIKLESIHELKTRDDAES
jgi:hypothetical protein